MKKPTFEYLLTLSEENAACLMRASCAEYNEINGQDATISIAQNVMLAIEFAINNPDTKAIY